MPLLIAIALIALPIFFANFIPKETFDDEEIGSIPFIELDEMEQSISE